MFAEDYEEYCDDQECRADKIRRRRAESTFFSRLHENIARRYADFKYRSAPAPDVTTKQLAARMRSEFARAGIKDL